ncbi:hypothetical protein X943_002951 [Babesia divergens]|uniref:Uncharacterized protein n=1 Tax=Babesia divergens TaxID=32595 RepID=A0AAD9GDC8_BABDI|nr:hypothetical protein X943_002951 [Babesia divergens]
MEATDINTVFQNYANKRSSRLESRMFIKIFRQAGLLDSKVTANDLDIIFVKNRAKGARTLDPKEFAKAIKEVSKLLAIENEVLVARLVNAGGPVYSGTDTLPVRFYDDKSSYTGVHAHGGPSVK